MVYITDPPTDGWTSSERTTTDPTEAVSSSPHVEGEDYSDTAFEGGTSPEYIEAKVRKGGEEEAHEVALISVCGEEIADGT